MLLPDLSSQELLQLIHWTYTRDEWKAFVRCTKKKRGLFYLAADIFLPRKKNVPEILVTPQKVYIGDNQVHFNNAHRTLERVHIRDEGPINIIVITYRDENSRKRLQEISFPVPKGKLKEAIELEQGLNKLLNKAKNQLY
jgi:hypothetical protein